MHGYIILTGAFSIEQCVVAWFPQLADAENYCLGLEYAKPVVEEDRQRALAESAYAIFPCDATFTY